MNVLIKSATIIDNQSDFHSKTQDILVEKGIITKIANRINNPNNLKEIRLENLHISQGWFDSSVSFGEPGYEERETISNGLKTAAHSGFTSVALNANTDPVLSANTDIAFITSKASSSPVDLYAIGALTKQSKGEALAELYDMKSAGAIAFGDFQKPVSNANLMKIALQYASTFNALVLSFPQDNSIAAQGVMNEHIASTSLGLKGIPALSEEIQIARDLFLLEYTGGKLHIPTISTQGAVNLIREAKAKKLDVSCSVAIHNLVFTDNELTSFNTNFKVLPPLRTQQDIDALLAGLKDGTIDMVTSDHNPLNIELKKTEFDFAHYGTIGLESAFGALCTVVSTKAAVKYLTRGKERFGISNTPIEVGNRLNVTLFNPDERYTFSRQNMVSKSKNSIFEGFSMKGKPYGIISNSKLFM